MPFVSDPFSGLRLLDLSHPWGPGVPSYPGQEDVRMTRAVKHAQHGVLAWRISTSLHTGTHLVAPIHLIQRGADLAAIPAERLFGNGLVLNLPKSNFQMIDQADLAAAGEILPGDFVVINTGWHHKYADGIEYFGHAPGLTPAAAQYLVDCGIKALALDTPFADAPLATIMGLHRGGPQMKRLPDEYRQITGREAADDFPARYPATKILLQAGIPVILQAGGDLDEISGKRATLTAAPWRFEHGEACPVRLVAMINPDGNCRIAPGQKGEA